ncbi:MAG: hypothetical protein ORO03_10885, partial [Alphaproteobacteria bacterium]|nr:hypothetical protein [Alphaproteobacteria bacterium]
VLRRLAELNHQRYEEEVSQGLHGDAGARTPRRATSAALAHPSLDLDMPRGMVAGDASPASAILDFLGSHAGWHAKANIFAATGILDGQWSVAIADLIGGGKVERQGERRGARYRVPRTDGEP